VVRWKEHQTTWHACLPVGRATNYATSAKGGANLLIIRK
jgi:hypothetical protein